MTPPHPLQELINKLCPNGVEFKPLQKVCNLKTGDRITTAMMHDNAPYPVMGGGTKPTGYYDHFNFEEAVTIARAGSAGYVSWQSGRFWATDVCFVATSKIIKITPCAGSTLEASSGVWGSKEDKRSDFAIQAPLSLENTNLKFVFYFLKNHEQDFKQHLYGGSMPKLDKNYLWNLPIPIPPLEIQNRIVRILDTFTELDKELKTELERELELRNKQYEYYRNTLLSLESLQELSNKLAGGAKVEMCSLGEIGTFTRGNGLAKADFVESGVPCIHYGQIYTQYQNIVEKTISFVSHQKAQKFKKAKRGDLIIARTSENKEDICKAVVYLGDSEVCISGHSFAFSHSQNPKFIGYLFQTNAFHDFKKKNIFGTKVYDIHQDRLANFQIPLPSIDVQNEIVRILDKFDSLINSISNGLPREIELRKKQYTYYRDILLNFKKED